MSEITDKWTRELALEVRGIKRRMNLCCCGTEAHWTCILNLLIEAENHSKDGYEGKGFYRDEWFEFGAKVIDSWGLIEHGTGIGWAWLTDEGKLFLAFLRDFGVEGGIGKDHPLWSIEYSWDTDASGNDCYSTWVKENAT